MTRAAAFTGVLHRTGVLVVLVFLGHGAGATTALVVAQPGWVAFDVFAAPDETFSLVVEARPDPSGAVGVEYRLNDGTLESFASAPGLPIEAGIADAGSHGTRLPPGSPLRLVHKATGGFDGQVLVWAAGGVRDWRITLDAGASGSAAKIGEASGAYYWKGGEDAEGMHAHVALSHLGVSLSDARYAFDVQETFRGFAGLYTEETYVPYIPPSDVSDDRILMEHPNGRIQRCVCVSYEWGPGRYVLDWEGHRVFGQGHQPVLLAGVDAPTWIQPQQSRG